MRYHPSESQSLSFRLHQVAKWRGLGAPEAHTTAVRLFLRANRTDTDDCDRHPARRYFMLAADIVAAADGIEDAIVRAQAMQIAYDYECMGWDCERKNRCACRKSGPQ